MSNSEIIRNSKHLLKNKYNLVMGPYFVGFLILQLIQTPTNNGNYKVEATDLPLPISKVEKI